jgi:hypothetical protein
MWRTEGDLEACWNRKRTGAERSSPTRRYRRAYGAQQGRQPLRPGVWTRRGLLMFCSGWHLFHVRDCRSSPCQLLRCLLHLRQRTAPVRRMWLVRFAFVDSASIERQRRASARLTFEARGRGPAYPHSGSTASRLHAVRRRGRSLSHAVSHQMLLKLMEIAARQGSQPSVLSLAERCRAEKARQRKTTCAPTGTRRERRTRPLGVHTRCGFVAQPLSKWQLRNVLNIFALPAFQQGKPTVG